MNVCVFVLTEILVNTDSSRLRADKYMRIRSPPNRRPRYSGIVTICERETGSAERMARTKQINRQIWESSTCGEKERDCESMVHVAALNISSQLWIHRLYNSLGTSVQAVVWCMSKTHPRRHINWDKDPGKSQQDISCLIERESILPHCRKSVCFSVKHI